MEFNELITDFATRHNVAGLAAEDGAAALDIDGIVVSLVSKGESLTIAAEIGEPPAEGAAAFANLLLEANLQSDMVFAKDAENDVYVAMRHLVFAVLDGDAFDTTLEAFVNQTDTWRRLLADFRPVAQAAAENDKTESPSFGSNTFMQV